MPRLVSRSEMRRDMDDGGTEKALAALVKLPDSTTLQKYLSASSWFMGGFYHSNYCQTDKG